MLTTLIAAAIFSQVPAGQTPVPAQPQEAVTAKSLIEKMLQRYASAKSAEGRIVLTQSARNVSVVTTTEVAYEKPSKLLVVQRQGGSSPKKSLIVSDGSKFVYTRPERLITSSDFLAEEVQPEGRPAQTVGDLYAIVASELPDRSSALDLVIGRPDDLRFASNQFITFVLDGKSVINGKTVYIVKGKWRESSTETTMAQAGVGEYAIYIAENGDLVRYILVQKYGVPNPDGIGASTDTVVVTNNWDLAVNLDSAVKPGTFSLKGH